MECYFNIQDYAKIESHQSYGTVLFFEQDSIYGTLVIPETGNINLNLAGAKRGVISTIIHNSATAPSFSAEFELRGGGVYQTGQINYISCMFVDATKIIYTIL